MNGHCHGCGGVLAPNKAPGRTRKWCSERCRKRTLYSGTCVDCGAPTCGDGGLQGPPERCSPCSSLHRREWTDEQIISALQAWATAYGRPPRVPDWSAAHARQCRVDAWQPAVASDHPAYTVVQRRFGSWEDGLRAAGRGTFDPAQDHDWGPGRLSAKARRAA